MGEKPNYRFKFEIVDEASGEVIGTDYCPITNIDQFGGCETVDMHVASTLRWFNRTGRQDHEHKD